MEREILNKHAHLSYAEAGMTQNTAIKTGKKKNNATQ